MFAHKTLLALALMLGPAGLAQQHPVAATTASLQNFTVHVLRPGETVVGIDGVEVSAPTAWTLPTQEAILITIERVEPASIPNVGNEKLQSPVYEITSNVWVVSKSGQFVIRIPVTSALPDDELDGYAHVQNWHTFELYWSRTHFPKILNRKMVFERVELHIKDPAYPRLFTTIAVPARKQSSP